jgi:hypothetical protein
MFDDFRCFTALDLEERPFSQPLGGFYLYGGIVSPNHTEESARNTLDVHGGSADTQLDAIAEADGLIDYLILAAEDTLQERELGILDGRFGLFGGEGHTLQELGVSYGVSRERIRQIVNKSLRKLTSKGRRQLHHGQSDEPCAQLIHYVRETVRAREEGEVERLYV